MLWWQRPRPSIHGAVMIKYLLYCINVWQKYVFIANSSGNRNSIFSCDQAALRTLISVCPSVRPSVRLSHLFDYVPVIVSSWNFQDLLPLTDTMPMQKVKVRGQRSRSQRSWTHLLRFRTVTPVWIHIWQWNDAQSLMLLRRCTLLFFKVIRQISRSHSKKKIVDFDPNWAFRDGNSSLNSPLTMKWCTKVEAA